MTMIDKDHKQSAPLGIARATYPGFPFEALVLHLELARSRLTKSLVLLVLG